MNTVLSVAPDIQIRKQQTAECYLCSGITEFVGEAVAYVIRTGLPEEEAPAVCQGKGM